MYRLIQTLTAEPVEVPLGDAVVPAPAVCEDEHGILLLLLPDPGHALTPGQWADAQGVSYVVAPHGQQWATVPAAVYDTAGSIHWTLTDGLPTAATVVQTAAAAEGEVVAQGFVHLHNHTEYCLAPETRVVTEDMVWKPIGDVVPGEVLVGFDEDLRPPEGERGISRSKMRPTEVLATKRVMRDCYRITLEDGTQIVASAQHGWVANGTGIGSLLYPGGPQVGYGANTRRWITTDRLKPGKSRLILWARPWEPLPPEQEADAAYLAGILDGEGWISHGQLSIGQNPGPVMDRIMEVCQRLGYPTTEVRQQGRGADCLTFRFQGYETALRVLSQCPSVRLSPRMDEVWVGRRAGGRYSRPVLVTSLEYLGQRETVAIQTTTKTFVAEGFLSHNSALDGLTKVEEAIEVIKADGQNALGISDHNVVAGHPEFLAACRKAGVRPVLGYEANLVEDRHRRGRTWWAKVDPATGIEYEIDVEGLSPEEIKKMGVEKRSDSQEVLGDYHHLTLWAMNDTGLRNIWAISTIGYTEGFYGRPKIDWEVLERFSEGVIAATGCLRGPLARPYLDGHEEVARTNVARLAEIYGDRLYVEIHSNRLDDQIKVNKFAVRLGREMGLPLLAVTDSHYPTREDDITHRSWLAKTSSQSLSDETTLFAGEQDYHLATEAEVREALSYLDPQAVDEAVENTAVLANRCSVTFGREPDPPNYSKPTTAHPDPVAWDEERLWERIMDGWERKVAPLGEAGVDLAPYEERLVNEEWPLITDKRFCGYFLVVSDYVRNAKFDQKILVGPGRGSGGGCLIAWLTDITELDPVKFDLMFGRFLNPGRTELPDFDVDFPASKREAIKGYVVQRWGEDRTVSIGTTRRVGIRAAIDGAIRVLRPYLEEHEIPGFAEIKAFKEAEGQSKAAAAGTEVTWETFVTEHEDLITGLQERYPLVMAMTENFVGRVDGYGKHPAGVVVSTDEPLTYLPMRVDDEGNLISQFDMNALAALGFTKFDLLTLRTLDTLQVTVDLIRERYGVEIDFYSWNEQYEDPQVWEEISNGNTLGIFQIETHLGTQLCKAYRPASIDDLAAVITLVRPGPRRSGLTDQYLRRRDGKEPVTYVDPRLEEALAPTYGVPIYQEQVMAITMILAGYDTVKADQVRSILGKKKVDKVAAAGVEFVAAAVERGMERKAAETLWAQLAEFAKYGFGKAHAYGYAVLGYWAAWLKFHFPVQFLTACLSTVDNERIPEFVNEARKMGYDIALPDINESGVHFTPLDTKVRYGLADVPGIGESTAEHIVARQPYTSLEDFRERALGGGGPVNLGHLRALVRIGAFDSIIPNRRAAVMELDAEADKSLFRCVFKDDAVSGPNGLPCTFDWANEPDPPMVARGRGKNKVYVPKPPPARCTKACRNYTPPPPLDPAAVEPYSHDEIMELEKEALGVWLSATPFDRVPQDILEGLEKASQVQAGDPGEYVVAATIEGVRQRTDRTGGTYAFLTLFAQDGLLEGVCFASVYSGVNQHCKPGRLVFAVLRKDASQRLEIRDVIPSE